MSRHRDVRNINIHDELDDDALDDGGEEMTDEQLAQMHEGLQAVRDILGSAETSGISDQDIKDALWEFYFDQERTVEWALEEQTRRQQAKERKVPNVTKELPPLPHEVSQSSEGGYSPSNEEYYHPENFEHDSYTSGPRVPAIFLAQQQQGYEQGYEEPVDDQLDPWEYSRRRSYLTTIMERSERTETTPRWSPMTRQLPPPTPLSRPSSITESYGEPLEESQYRYSSPGHVDPNLIPVSPPASALGRLSLYEPPPSQPTSDSRSDGTVTPRKAPSEVAPLPEVLPEIPDYVSKAGSKAGSEAGTEVAPDATPTQKKSKLARLASSRASARSQPSEPPSPIPSPASSVPPSPAYNPAPIPRLSKLSLLASSRSSLGTESYRSSALDSVRTYPALRPTPESLASPKPHPPASIASSDHEIGANAEYYNPNESRESTAMSSVVNRAILAAMELEAMDNTSEKSEKSAKSEKTEKPSSHVKRASSASSKVQTPTSPTKGDVTPKSRASTLLAAKSSKSEVPPSIHSFKEVQTFRAAGEKPAKEPSKLAKLAMAKTKAAATKGTTLPKPVTEYLVPTANGPTATTAITTSYQSLFTLTDPNQSQIIPEQYVVPIGGTLPSPGRSKLAMKSKRGQLREESTIASEDEYSYIPPTIFSSPMSDHVRASPSAFASLLLKEGLTGSGIKDKEKRRKHKDKEKKRHREEGSVKDSVKGSMKTGVTADSWEIIGSQFSENGDRLPIPGFSAKSGFKFDGPSPDDIVMNARRGTALGQQKAPTRKPIAA